MTAPPELFAGAYHGLLESLGCALRSLQIPACRRLLGPLVPGATLTQGARVPGTSYELDPAMAAFNIGTMIGWSGCRAYPAEKLAAILPVADYLARRAHNEGRSPLCVRDVLAAMIQAQRPQADGASAAVLARLLGGGRAQMAAALCRDPHPAPDASAGPWGVGEAAARAVHRAFLAMQAESSARSGQATQATQTAQATVSASAAAARGEAAPGATDTFADSVTGHFAARQAALIRSRIADRDTVIAMPVHEFVALLVKNG